MITLARQIQLKVKKFDEVMIKLKTKYLDNPAFYSITATPSSFALFLEKTSCAVLALPPEL